MSTKPLATVQMLAYNHAQYIHKAMEGVLAQSTDFPFEVVIGEDCSTDGTREIVLDYQRRYPEIVRAVISEKNGMHKNVLRTQQASRGDYLAFCETDDYWHDPAKLQTQVDFLRKNPDYGLTHCNYHTYEVGRRKLEERVITGAEPPDDDHAYLQILLRQRRILTLTVCVRRDLLDRVIREQPECTDERWPMGDTQRWFEISRLTRVKYFPQAMATHNFLPESASQSRDPMRAFRFTEKAGQLILHYLAKYPIAAEHDQRVRRRVGLELLAAACEAGARDKADHWFDQLRQTAGGAPFDAWLYLFAVRGPARVVGAKPAMWMLSNGRRVRDRLLRLLRGETNRA